MGVNDLDKKRRELEAQYLDAKKRGDTSKAKSIQKALDSVLNHEIKDLKREEKIIKKGTKTILEKLGGFVFFFVVALLPSYVTVGLFYQDLRKHLFGAEL